MDQIVAGEDVAVVLLVFNRPELTRRIVERLASVRPQKLFVVSDGPRPSREGDAERVAAVRSLFEKLPWACELQRNYAAVNLGCAARVASGISWAFQYVEEAIILEDDCLPDPTFFGFAAELLKRYRNDTTIGGICASTPGFVRASSETSYWFSRYCFVWGWATWRRAWDCYDHEMMPMRDGSLAALLRTTLQNRRARFYWKVILRRTGRGRINSWAYRWTLSCWKHGMLAVVPSVNLIENIGFSAEASHTHVDIYKTVAARGIEFPLLHPLEIESDAGADIEIEDRIYSRSLPHRLTWCWRRAKEAVMHFLR